MRSPTESCTQVVQRVENRSPLPWWKRSVDVILCLAALPAFGLLTLAVAAWATINSPGPVFFVQERVGHRGRKFKLYKFRTMHLHAETKSHQFHFSELVSSKAPMQKLDTRGDARLISCGAVLRAMGIDELPQILNVLRGEMSMVGPRPCIPYEYHQYSARQRERFAAVPGLTGLWQVSGKNRTTFDEMVQLDIAYARSQSLRLDTKIMFLTIPAILVQLSDLRKIRKKTKVCAPTSSVPSIQLAHTARWENVGHSTYPG